MLDDSSDLPAATGHEPILRRDVAQTGTSVVLTLRGEADLASSPDLLQHCYELLDLPVENLALDMAGVTFIDSSAVSALIETRRRANERGVALQLVSLPAQARRVLEITGVIGMFDVRGDAARE